MAEVTLNPMFAGINGRIGNIVLFKRYGKHYARIYVDLRNPDSEAQGINRISFSDAVAAWKALLPEEKLSWNKLARVYKRRGYNLFLSEYMNGKTNGQELIAEENNAYGEYSSGIVPRFSFFTESCSLCSITPYHSVT